MRIKRCHGQFRATYYANCNGLELILMITANDRDA